MPGATKKPPAPGWPPEEGCYLRGSETSSVAVTVVLRSLAEGVPPEIDSLVSVAVVKGAALSGTQQTENIGLEKVICNVVSNPNIRYLIVCGPESPHGVGDAWLALVREGMDEKRRIVGAKSPNAYLYNLPSEYVERFRKQIRIVDLIGELSPEIIGEAIQSCCAANPARFRDLELGDPGAYEEEPLSGKIEWRVTEFDKEPKP